MLDGVLSMLHALLTPVTHALQRDDVRTTMQTVSAVLLAYGIMQLLPMDTASWAVFSALFVVQSNIGGTIDLALWRVGGALVGAVIAVALMLTLGQSGTRVGALAAGVLAMSVISVRWPALSYGLVTVAIITAAPDIQFIESTAEKVMAIAVGSCSAILACLTVFPTSAHYSAKYQLARALRISGKYLMECMSSVAREDAGKTQNTQAEAIDALHKASSMWRQTGTEKPSFLFRKKHYVTMSHAVLDQAGHLQQSMALADRFSQAPPSCRMSDEAINIIQELADTLQEELVHLGDAIMARRNHSDIAAVWTCYGRFCDAMDQIANDADSLEDREYLMALKWACHSIIASIESLAHNVDDAYGGKNDA